MNSHTDIKIEDMIIISRCVTSLWAVSWALEALGSLARTYWTDGHLASPRLCRAERRCYSGVIAADTVQVEGQVSV